MKTGDPELMREINRFHILDLIRRHGPIARVEIGARGDLSSTTVSAITGAMIEDGIIQPVSVGGIHESTARGRPRVMLQLNPDAARVAGLRIGPHGIATVVTDFRGEVLSSVEAPVRVRRQPVSVVADLAEDTVRRAVVEAGLTLDAIDSVCATLPGVVEYGTGLVRLSPIFAGRDVLFGEALTSRLGIGTIVESDANALALAEHWFGSCREIRDFAAVFLDQSIGLGVLHGGQLFRGACGISHDIGCMVLGETGESGAFLRLIDLASEQAVLEAFEADPVVRDAVQAGLGLRQAVKRFGSDAAPLDLVARAGRAIGVAVANVATFFAPPRIVLSGSLLHLGAPLTDAIAQSFTQAVAEPLAEVTKLVLDPPRNVEELGRGAAAVALYELYGSPWNTTGPVRPS